jgi:F-type H+-transporting ATPase subunit alpha
MSVEKQVAIIYLGTQGLLSKVPVRKVKEFEEHFLVELENKHPELLAEFKKGNLPEEGIKQMTEMANGLMSTYK